MKKLIKHWQENNLYCGTTTVHLGSFTKDNIISKARRMLFGINKIVMVQQTHSNNVIFADGNTDNFADTDGLLTNKRGVLLAVRTADCLPIFFYDEKAKIAAIIHAGWKGLFNNIILNIINMYKKNDVILKNLKVYIGPHIKRNCYEVSKKMANLFMPKISDTNIVKKIHGKYYLDLTLIAHNQLINSGISAHNVSISPYCTYCSNLFYSYRGNLHNKKIGIFDGEMMSFIKII